MRQINFWIKVLVFVTVLVPLVVTPFTSHSFVFGKMILLRIIASVAVILALIYFILKIKGKGQGEFSLGVFRNPVVVSLFIFMASALTSTIFSDSSYRAFFGEVERGEGLYSFLAYFVIFVIAFLFFDKKDWRKYFQFGLIVGVLIILHSLLQYLGFNALFESSLHPRQPGSLIGNPAFLASFFMFVIAYAALIWGDSRGFWRYFSAAAGFAALIMTILLGIRGALLGIVLAFMFFVLSLVIVDKRRWIKVFSLAFVLVFLVLGVSAAFTPQHPLWDGVPVFDRVSDFTLDSASVQTRIFSFGISYNAFKERPVFGWGPEGYSVVYNKYYEPDYAIYSEEWFDRAHNKILDLLVTQGALGLVSYLVLFSLVFYSIFKLRHLSLKIRFLLASLFIAYFTQNLFTFDHVSSYLPFFMIISYLAFWRRSSEEKITVNLATSRYFVTQVILLLIISLTAYSVVAWNINPLLQARNLKIDGFYNFAQKELRMKSPFSVSSVLALEEIASLEPDDARLKVRLAEAYNHLGVSNPEFFEKSLRSIKEAEELSPRRQAIKGVRALTLSGVGMDNEAIGLARKGVSLELKAPKPHYYLGMVLALSLSGEDLEQKDFKAVRDEAFEELKVSLSLASESNYVPFFSELDFRNMLIVYQNLDEGGDVFFENFAIFTGIYPQYIDFYKIGLVKARDRRNKDVMILSAERIGDLEPFQKEEMDTIIDLARREKWDILDSL